MSYRRVIMLGWLWCCLSLVAQSALAQTVSMDDKLAQMLMVGFKGLSVDDKAPIVRAIHDQHIGGVILFAGSADGDAAPRNIQSPIQLKKLIADLQQASQTPLFIAVDQEGGRIERLSPKTGFSHTLSAAELGQRDDKALTQANAQVIAKELHAMGFNVDFAPVVDLNLNPNNPIIGKLDRSFSADPNKVIAHADIFAAALREQGVACALKHFPGHGSSQGDSHKGFVDVSNTWRSAELAPFQQMLAQQQCQWLMVAHVFNSKLDPIYPASLSEATIDGLLRQQWHYQGLVVTDDLHMGAISQHYSLRDTLKLAVNAGNDILLLGNNAKTYEPMLAQQALTLLKDLLAKGEISAAKVNMAYERIQRAKQPLAASAIRKVS